MTWEDSVMIMRGAKLRVASLTESNLGSECHKLTIVVLSLL